MERDPDSTPTARLADALVEAVQRWLDIAVEINEGLEHFTCREAEALAELFRSVGRLGDARHVINCHAWGDDDGNDEHHALYRCLTSTSRR